MRYTETSKVTQATLETHFEKADLERVKIHHSQKWLRFMRPFGGGLGLSLGWHIFILYEPADTLKFTKMVAHEIVHSVQVKDTGLWSHLRQYFIDRIRHPRLNVSKLSLEKPAYEMQIAVEQELRQQGI